MVANLISRTDMAKKPAIRSKKIRASAKGRQCTAQIYGICMQQNETVVFAHLPSGTHGMGYKSDDYWGGYCCSACHDAIDGRRPYKWKSGERESLLLRILHNSWRLMIDEGVIVIKGANV